MLLQRPLHDTADSATCSNARYTTLRTPQRAPTAVTRRCGPRNVLQRPLDDAADSATCSNGRYTTLRTPQRAPTAVTRRCGPRNVLQRPLKDTADSERSAVPERPHHGSWTKQFTALWNVPTQSLTLFRKHLSFLYGQNCKNSTIGNCGRQYLPEGSHHRRNRVCGS